MSNVRTCKGCNFNFFDNSNFDSAAGMCGPCSRRAKCPVFGCTIPRGIPHEHPAGVSAVMRDPAAPLTDIERAELQWHRYQAIARNQAELALAVNQVPPSHIGCVPGQANISWPGMNPGRKLRDALLMAGIADADAGRTKPLSGVKARYADNKATASVVVNELSYAAFDQILADRHVRFKVTTEEADQVRRLSVVQIACRIATGILLATGVSSILILSAMTAGWL